MKNWHTDKIIGDIAVALINGTSPKYLKSPQHD